MRAYSRFGNDYVNVHPNDLFLAVPFGGTGDRVPGKARSKFEKGNQFLLKDQFDKAKQQYEAALADYPDYASARLNLGVAELNLKDAGHAGFVNLIWPLLIVSFGPTPTLVVRLVEKPAAVGAVGKMGIARVVRDFQGRWEGRKTCFWFSSLSTDRPAAGDDVLTSVVAGCHKPEIVMKQAHQPGQIAHSARDVLVDIAAIFHAQPPSGRRHELHQAPRALRRDRTGPPVRFPLDNRAYERNGHTVVPRIHRGVIFGRAAVLRIRWLRRFGSEVRSYDQHERQGEKPCHKALPSRLCAVYCCAS